MLEELKQRKCRQCRKVYQPKVEHQKYCSYECRYTVANNKKAAMVREYKKSRLQQQDKGAA
jgi:hypothetical protein